MLTRRALHGLLLAPCLPVFATPQNAPIVWGWHHRPPFFINEGLQAGQGSIDGLRRLLQAGLKGFEHREVQAPIARILHEIRAGQNWCVAGFINTPERQAYVHASVPFFAGQAHRILILRRNRARFDALAPLSLVSLLRDRSLRTAFERDRSYGSSIDSLINARPQRQSRFASADQGVRMLLKGHLDYLLDYEATATYYASQLNAEGGLQSLPFQEMTEHVVLHVLCPRNDWGQQVIVAVDQVLLAERPSAAYRRLVEKGQSAQAVAELRQVYEALLLHQSKP